MKVSVEQIKVEEVELKVGQIYKGHSDYYMVTKAINGSHGEIYYNLTNLASGNRWTEELCKDQLEAVLKFEAFKLVNVKELVIKEEI